jgi:hypothetical protein
LSEANPFVAGTVKAASNSAAQNCTIRATTTGTFGDSVTAVNCQGAVNFDIENCELLAISATNQTNDPGMAASRFVWKKKWRILPVGEVHDQRAAWQGGHRRNAPWARVSGRRQDRWRVTGSRWAS